MCTKFKNACAEQLFNSLDFSFSQVRVAVAVVLFLMSLVVSLGRRAICEDKIKHGQIWKIEW